jgi:hypothetical protein
VEKNKRVEIVSHEAVIYELRSINVEDDQTRYLFLEYLRNQLPNVGSVRDDELKGRLKKR